MPIAQDDNGIAVVMGHEVAHAVLRHGAERMSQEMSLQVVGEVLSVGLGKAAPGLKDGVLQAYASAPLSVQSCLGAEHRNRKPIMLGSY